MSTRAGAPFKVLIVDDSDDFRRILMRALSAEGIECHEASDGVIASNLLRTRRFDLVCLDLVMPRVHGHKLAVDLLEAPTPPMVIVATGMTDARLARDLLGRGVADVMYKPLSVELFAAKAKVLLERAREAAARPVPGTAASHSGSDISQATEALRGDFARMTEAFERTIKQLEQKKSELQSGFIISVQMFISLMDRTGQAGSSHAGRVEKACTWYAEQLGFGADARHEVQVAAVLHEIGQFGMPDYVRTKKPWELTPDERLVYEKYPIMGATLLSEIKGAEGIAEVIECHAENYAGNGFPHRLAGENIPLGARVLRLADGVDTFQMFAPNTCGKEDIIAYLNQKKSVVFDPALVPLAIRYLQVCEEQPEDDTSTLVPADRLPHGARLVENVYDPDGRFLARAGAEIGPALAARLGKLLGAAEVRIQAPTAGNDGTRPAPTAG